MSTYLPYDGAEPVNSQRRTKYKASCEVCGKNDVYAWRAHGLMRCDDHMPKRAFFTFGQNHRHVKDIGQGQVVFDKDVVLVIEAPWNHEPRKVMYKLFGARWSMEYSEQPSMHHFPRGFLYAAFSDGVYIDPEEIDVEAALEGSDNNEQA